jgi:hypothetical protein
MELDRSDESSKSTRTSARRARELQLARRTRIAAIVIVCFSIVLLIGSIISQWMINFSTDPTFGSPNTPFRYKFSNFMQNVAYTAGFPLLAVVASIALLVFAERMKWRAEEFAEKEQHQPPEQQLTVDLTHPVAPTLPRQGSVDDSMWRPPDFEPADNPWQRSS